MNSRVHPKYKRRKRSFRVDRVSNWAEYDRALVQRGDITLCFAPDATDAWSPEPSGKRGGQRKFSDQAIETALVLRLVFKLPLRQAEGFVRWVLSLMALDLETPDPTTISRRSQQVDIGLRLAATRGRLHLIVDSTGLSIIGEGEWAAVKYGGRGKRAWKKLHLGVDRSGMIIAEILTDGNADDARTALGLIDEMDGVASFTADTAYDTLAIYDAATARGAKVIVPPRMSATRSMRSCARDRTVRRSDGQTSQESWSSPVEEGIGIPPAGSRREHLLQGDVADEATASKSIISDRLRARHPKSQEAEAVIACNFLNRMAEIGWPESFPIGSG